MKKDKTRDGIVRLPKRVYCLCCLLQLQAVTSFLFTTVSYTADGEIEVQKGSFCATGVTFRKMVSLACSSEKCWRY